MGELIERVKNLIIGYIIGMISILPGISGAVVAAIFGVYERMVEDLGNLRVKIKEDFWFLITLGVGLIVGAIVFSHFYKNYIEYADFYFIVIALFMGMIAGQLPDVYTIARSNGEPVRASHIAWFAIGFVSMMAIVVFQILYGISDAVWDGTTTAYVLMFITGLIFAVGGLLPGFAAPTLLLAIGLFGLMTDALSFSSLNFTIFLLFAAGVVVGILGFSKVMDRVLKRYHALTYFTVLGLTAGSIFTIVSVLNDGLNAHSYSLGSITLCIAAGIIGFVLSLVASHYGRMQRAGTGVSEG